MTDSGNTSWCIPDDELTIEAVKRLGKLLRFGNACALIGAGVSAQVGYPTWSQLLDLMGKEVERSGERSKNVASLNLQKDALWRAEEYRRLLTEQQYLRFFTTTFADERLEDPIPAIMLDIVGLNWKHVFTTNYDRSLQLSHKRRFGSTPPELEWSDRAAVREFLASLNHELVPLHYVHLHGSIRKPDQIIFSYRDYVERYIKADEMIERLFVLFSTQFFAFIGFSLDDPDFVQILRQVNSRLGSTPMTHHFAIIPASVEDPIQVERRRLEGKYDVSPIFYRHVPGDGHIHFGSVIAELLRLQEE